jgi:hypothetical protein
MQTRSTHISDTTGLEGILWSELRRWRTAQQAFGTQVFIEIGPMEAVAAAGDFPPVTLLWGSVQEPRIPSQRNNDGSAVHEIDGQTVRRAVDVRHAFIRRERENTHATPP